jgi:cysteine-rich repeat protein
VARFKQLVLALAGSSALIACTFGWDELDPRVTEGSGGSTTSSGPGSGGGSSGAGGEGATGSSSSGGNSGGGGSVPICGDGDIEGDEVCDDGNTDDGDSCAGDCMSGTVIAFSDDCESGEGGWTHELLGGAPSTSDEWALSGAEVHGGANAWHSGATANDEGDTRLISPSVDLTTYGANDSLMLRFWHWYEFDDCGDPMFQPDGAIVEVSADGGAFATVTPVGGYPSTIDGSCMNPLSGPGFAHGSTGYEEVLVDISSYIGSSVEIGFHVGWDCGNCMQPPGWFIDDIEIFATLQ